MSTSLENDDEKAIVGYVRGLGGYALKLILLNKLGFPDRTILLPGGKIMFLEMKRLKKSQTRTYEWQKVWGRRLQMLGFISVICYGYHEAKAAIDNLLET